MSRFLLIDIGAGTMDILYFDDDSGISYKAVAKSPVRYLAEKASSLPGSLLVTGREMGGGPVTQVLAGRAREAEVVMTESSALTVHHDLERVRALGIHVVEDQKAEELGQTGQYSTLELCDLELGRLLGIIEGFGVPFEFDIVGICAQDHGMPPHGVSHLDYRHNVFKSYLDPNPFPDALLFSDVELPATFNRLRSIGETAAKLPAREIYLMDSGMAAILGASKDIRTSGKRKVMVLDVATSHTVGATLDGEEIAGFFEYHTHQITLVRLELLLRELADGSLEHRRILEEGGHGAYLRKTLGFEEIEIIIATGPQRGLLKGSSLAIVYGAPFGDNMMTGAVGLLESIRRRKGLAPIAYL